MSGHEALIGNFVIFTSRKRETAHQLYRLLLSLRVAIVAREKGGGDTAVFENRDLRRSPGPIAEGTSPKSDAAYGYLRHNAVTAL